MNFSFKPRAQQNGFNPYSAGNKMYGAGRSNPTMGPVDPTGYKERDQLNKLKRSAIINRLRMLQGGV